MSARRAAWFRDEYTEAVWEPNALRPNEVLVALAYARYAGSRDNPRGDVSWVPWPRLSTMTGIRSRDALSRALKGLVAAGWMTQIEPARQHRAPRYQLTIPADPEVRETYTCTDDDHGSAVREPYLSVVNGTTTRGTR